LKIGLSAASLGHGSHVRVGDIAITHCLEFAHIAPCLELLKHLLNIGAPAHAAIKEHLDVCFCLRDLLLLGGFGRASLGSLQVVFIVPSTTSDPVDHILLYPLLLVLTVRVIIASHEQRRAEPRTLPLCW
jgi:hypothetical protein|tara:strand:- start:923 stop:1312 length:390 start_codon:yes stop_codon:yes gene_type:complete